MCSSWYPCLSRLECASLRQQHHIPAETPHAFARPVLLLPDEAARRQDPEQATTSGGHPVSFCRRLFRLVSAPVLAGWGSELPRSPYSGRVWPTVEEARAPPLLILLALVCRPVSPPQGGVCLERPISPFGWPLAPFLGWHQCLLGQSSGLGQPLAPCAAAGSPRGRPASHSASAAPLMQVALEARQHYSGQKSLHGAGGKRYYPALPARPAVGR